MGMTMAGNKEDGIDRWAIDLLRASGWTGNETHARRVILDIEVGKPLMVYVECYGDHGVFSVPIPKAFPCVVTEGLRPMRRSFPKAAPQSEREQQLTDLCDRAYAALGLWESQGGNTQSTQLRHDLKAALGIISPGEPADGQADDDAKTTKTR